MSSIHKDVTEVFTICFRVNGDSKSMVKQFEILETKSIELLAFIGEMVDEISDLPCVECRFHDTEDETNDTKWSPIVIVEFDKFVPIHGYVTDVITLIENEYVPYFLIASKRVLH